MKKRARIALTTVASIISLVGLVFIGETLVSLRSLDQLHRLLSYDYLSFVDSRAVGGMTNDFFTGVALLLIGSVLFIKVERTHRVGKIVAGLLLLFIALTLVYACLDTRIGIRPS